LNLEYYSQRASDGGLIFAEATTISPTGRGYRGAPGICSVQLWHPGPTTHIATTGEEPVTASVDPTYWADPEMLVVTPDGTPNRRRIGRSRRRRSPGSSSNIRGQYFLARRGFHERNERRERPMYYQAITQCTQAVKNVEAWLDKEEEHAAAKLFDVGVLITGRLARDICSRWQRWHRLRRLRSRLLRRIMIEVGGGEHDARGAHPGGFHEVRPACATTASVAPRSLGRVEPAAIGQAPDQAAMRPAAALANPKAF
jgi:hypothetical protein